MQVKLGKYTSTMVRIWVRDFHVNFQGSTVALHAYHRKVLMFSSVSQDETHCGCCLPEQVSELILALWGWGCRQLVEILSLTNA